MSEEGRRRVIGGVEEEMSNDAPTQEASAAASSNLGATLLRVAWLAILLGIAMEGTLLLLSAGFGNLLSLGSIVADLAKNVSWAVLVCLGLSVGTAVRNARVPVTGFLGFLAAPAAFEVSRVVHKGTLQALAISAGAGDHLSLFLVARIKGLEYGCFGLAIGWVSQRPWGGAAAHMAVGFAVGSIFGGIIVALLVASGPGVATVGLVSRGVTEVLFPVGCALVLFSAETLGTSMASQD
jgi:hypothetical protein